MKKLTLSFFCALCGVMLCWQTAKGQASGNANYQIQTHIPDQNINIGLPNDPDLYITVKGMVNVKTDKYVAIFNASQVGKTAEETNKLMNDRVEKLKTAIRTKGTATVFIDMISFVPVYETQVEKRIFSKKTYNEIPKGFEIRKNIHVAFDKPEILDELITACAEAEVYDLIRVDYVSLSLEQQKKELIEKCKTIMQEKVRYCQTVLGEDLTPLKKELRDGFTVRYPVEMYKTYQTYSNTSLNLLGLEDTKLGQSTRATTLYYQPIMDKEFDFVVNPLVVEPVIQVMYELKLKINRTPEVKPIVETRHYLLTPSGEVRKLDIGN